MSASPEIILPPSMSGQRLVDELVRRALDALDGAAAGAHALLSPDFRRALEARLRDRMAGAAHAIEGELAELRSERDRMQRALGLASDREAHLVQRVDALGGADTATHALAVALGELATANRTLAQLLERATTDHPRHGAAEGEQAR